MIKIYTKIWKSENKVVTLHRQGNVAETKNKLK